MIHNWLIRLIKESRKKNKILGSGHGLAKLLKVNILIF
jgi:hypothetical protein